MQELTKKKSLYLFNQRNTDLHTLAGIKRKKELKDLKFLVDNTIMRENMDDKFKENMRDICRKFNINMEVAGADFFNEDLPDLSKVPLPFNKKVG